MLNKEPATQVMASDARGRVVSLNREKRIRSCVRKMKLSNVQQTWHALFGFVTLVTMVSASTVTREKEALLQFKGNLSDTMQQLASWSDLSDPCDDRWVGVVCSSGSVDRQVQQLSLGSLQLMADVIPSSLQNLEGLQLLDLGGNDFRGSIPVWMGSFQRLTSLDLINNQLSGQIPSELSRLASTLENFRITNNSLTGAIPPEIGNLSRLTFWACESNALSGQIPSTLTNLKSIAHLHMDHNQLSGLLPDGFGNLSNLTHLILNDNLLSGTLPGDLGLSASLKHLKLDNNGFSGQIPVSYGSFARITDLRLRNNMLSESVPNSLSNLQTLEVLDLSFNSFQGPIPAFDNLRGLVSLSMENNNLTGEIPPALSDCPLLELINLSNNQLIGTIPQTLGLTGNLLSLDIRNNAITGPIPLSLTKPSVEFLAYGNPICRELDDKASSACKSTEQQNGPIPPTCYCPRGMLFRPFAREGLPSSGCDCVAPLLFKLFFPQVLLSRFSKGKLMRLEENVARELFLETQQVSIIQPPVQNGTGSDVSFLVYPLAGQALDYGTVERIRVKLNAPFPDQMWLDGEFGWYNYEVLQFIPPVVSGDYPPFPAPVPRVKGGKSKGRVSPVKWIPAVAGGAILIAIVTCLCFLVQRRRHKRRNIYQSDFSAPYIQGIVNQKASSSPGSMRASPVLMPRTSTTLHSFGPPVKIYSYEELSQATGNFGPESLIGSGGFGSVFKGALADGTLVAVKRLGKKNSKQGEAEFRTEVEMIAHQLHSPHLVRLRGYCSEGDERLLVYDLMPRGSLYDYLRDGTRQTAVALLDWKTRIQIGRDAAAGIRFLHECSPPVVHRDIKPSNILLDEQLNAKVADFGLSKMYPLPHSDHVTTRVVGTFGYLAPDYSITGKLTTKSDVYSFGIVLLEIIAGTHSTVAADANEDKMEQFLVPWAKPLLNDKQRVHEVLDPALEGAYPPKGLIKLATLVSSCLQLDPDRRPDMATVYNVLTSIDEMPVLTPKAREQREALVASTYVFRSRSGSSTLSSTQKTESGSGNPLPASPISGKTGPLGDSSGSDTSNSSLKMSSTSGLSISSVVASRGLHSRSENWSDRQISDDPSLYRTSEVFSDGRSSPERRRHRSTSKLSFSSSGRHEESPTRHEAPRSLVHDSLNPR